jgi:anti-sigma factor RsiW
MSCAYEEDLTAFVDRELPDLRARQIEAHLPGCEACRATLALIQRTVEQLASLPELETSPSLRRLVLRRVDELPEGFWSRARGWLRPVVLVPAMGMAAAAAVAVVVVERDRSAPASLDQLVVAENLEVLEDMDVVGLDSPDDLEVVAQLDELEAMP